MVLGPLNCVTLRATRHSPKANSWSSQAEGWGDRSRDQVSAGVWAIRSHEFLLSSPRVETHE